MACLKSIISLPSSISSFRPYLLRGSTQLRVLFSTHKKIEEATPSARIQLFNFLKKHGVTKAELRKYPCVLHLPEDEILTKLSLLSKNEHIEDAISLLLLSTRDLICYLELSGSKKGESIKQLADIFQISDLHASQLFLKYKFLMKSNMKSIREKFNLIIDGGIKREDLLKDLWVFNFSLESLKLKLKTAKEINLNPIKPWMLRYKIADMQRMGADRAEELAALAPHSSSALLLKECLGLNDWQLKCMENRHPPSTKVHGSKLRQLIEYLLIEGFTAEQIYYTPRILSHSIETIKERLKRLRKLNYEPYSLSILCKNRKVFEEFIMKLKEQHLRES